LKNNTPEEIKEQYEEFKIEERKKRQILDDE